MNTKLKPRLVASYDIWRGNGAWLFWRKDTREVNKKGKYKQEKKEASYKKQKEAIKEGNTHINNPVSYTHLTLPTILRV